MDPSFSRKVVSIRRE